MTLTRLLALVTMTLGLIYGKYTYATPILGVPVAGIGATADPQFGYVDGHGTIYYYVPLQDDGEIYGVDNGGLSAERCYFPGSCDGGSLTMYLYFEGLQGSADLNVLFTDLDESGFNDPWFFLENTALYDANGIEITDYSLSGNNHQQQMMFSADFGSAAYLELLFSSTFNANTPQGRYRNTAEALRATATGVSIPEPGTFALFGFGIAAMGLLRRRPTVMASWCHLTASVRKSFKRRPYDC